MKIQTLFALAILAGAVSTAWATGGGHRSCGGGGGNGEPDPNCVVTWDFTDNNTAMQGDPLTYAGTATNGDSYTLVVHGFTIGRGKTNGGSSLSYSGEIGDGGTTYSTDGVGSRYGIGVHAPGESTHWGTKIDNQKYDSEGKYLRDAVLLDFENCIVSVDEINLLKAYSGADTDFELWAYQGSTELVVNNSVIPQIPDYDNWAGDSDWTLVTQNFGDSSDRDVAISNAVQSRYFVLIAGANKNHNNDAFRLAGITVTCDPNNCGDNGGGNPGGGVPVPGTLALLGLGALLLGRKRFLKLA